MAPKLSSRVTGRSARSLAAALLVAVQLFALSCGSSSSPTEPGGALDPDAVEASSVSLLNGERSRAGLGQLWFDPVLGEIARRYSSEMRDQGFVSHYDPAGAAVDGRLRAAGVRFVMAGENIVTLGDTLDPAGDAHRGFMGSAPHRANIVGAAYTSVGVGVATNGDQWWITQIFIRE